MATRRIDNLNQDARKAFLLHENLGSEWIRVHQDLSFQDEEFAIETVLLPLTELASYLETDSWGFSQDAFAPGFNGNVKECQYSRYAGTGTFNLEPLVISRNYYGLRNEELELSEEFRLFHNAFTPDGRSYYAFDLRGNRYNIARMNAEVVEIHRLALERFIAAKQMALLIHFDSRISCPSHEVPSEYTNISDEYRDATTIYTLSSGKDHFFGGYVSRLLGTIALMPKAIETCGIYPFDEQRKQYADYCLGLDEQGVPIMHTCDPGRLSNYFGANPEAPHFLTPVKFSRDVLAKYYANPEKYSVGERHLRCGGLWGLHLDQTVAGYVTVYLGDLGQDLDYNEQLYWKTYNLHERGYISPSAWKTEFMVEAVEYTEPMSRVKYAFSLFEEAFADRFGFPAYVACTGEDEESMKAMHVPLTNAQAELDDQAIKLSKMIVERIDLKSLRQRLSPGYPSEAGGILVLRQFIVENTKSSLDMLVELFTPVKNLYTLAGGARHLKGKNYSVVLSSLPGDDFIAKFSNLCLSLDSLFQQLVQLIAERP